jgi:6,7-dimethyl-8-ribityllumazine synthase
VNTFVGEREGSGRRFAVVAARFNEIVTSKLVEGATAGLVKHGVAEDHIDVASSGRYDAVICLGAVIRGETAHFELVANEAARGIATVSLRTGVPLIFEVLATDDLAHAEARAGGAHGNKGWAAAEAALEMAGLLERLPAVEPGR